MKTIKRIIKEFDRLEKIEKSHYWRWQFLGCFLREKGLKTEKRRKSLADKSNKKIIEGIIK